MTFGTPLSAQQALQFRLAEMETSLEASRCLLARTAEALDRADADAAKLCAMAKQL